MFFKTQLCKIFCYDFCVLFSFRQKLCSNRINSSSYTDVLQDYLQSFRTYQNLIFNAFIHKSARIDRGGQEDRVVI